MNTKTTGPGKMPTMTERPELGAPAPDLRLLDATGAVWHLADRRGSTVVVIFHRHIH